MSTIQSCELQNSNQQASMTGSNPGTSDLLSLEEYARRKHFLNCLRGLSISEYSEIVRILKTHAVVFSENRNGIFFNVAALDQSVFDDLEKFLVFTQTNRRSLSDRDTFLSTLKHTKEIED
jgi:hypothetical protein